MDTVKDIIDAEFNKLSTNIYNLITKLYNDPELDYSDTKQNLPVNITRSITTFNKNSLVSNKESYASRINETICHANDIVIFENKMYVVDELSDLVHCLDLSGDSLYACKVRDFKYNSRTPSAICINKSKDFTSGDLLNKPSTLLICTMNGTIHSYNPEVDPNNSFVVVNENYTGTHSAFTSLIVANNMLHVVDFAQRKIHTYDSHWHKKSNYLFTDPDIYHKELNYVPYKIFNYDDYIYILYVKLDLNMSNIENGPGNGIISVFDTNGQYVRRFCTGGVLNIPCSMIPAPDKLGIPPGSFLIGNNGDGRINVFDSDGKFVCAVLSNSGLPVRQEKLTGLAMNPKDYNEIYMTSTVDETSLIASLVEDAVINF